MTHLRRTPLLVLALALPLACRDATGAESTSDDNADTSSASGTGDTLDESESDSAESDSSESDSSDSSDSSESDSDTDGPTATCEDGIKNQAETAVDCGGPCSGCADGLACWAATDCSSGTCDDLICGAKHYGVWGLGVLGNQGLYADFLPAINGFHFRFSWADFETAADVYDAAYIDDDVGTVVDDGLRVGLMMIVAPTSSGNTPDYVFNPPYDVDLVQTDTGLTFPHYFQAEYQSRYFAMLDALRLQLLDWDADMLAALAFWQSAEGSTGDEGPYKGDPLDMSHAITDQEWADWKRDEVWTPLAESIAMDLPGVALMVNQSNDGSNFAWALDNLPGAWLKAGEFTHYYNFSGEGHYATRLQSLRGSPSSEHRVRGELEGVTEAPWWTMTASAPAQNTFAIACSALHAGVDILNISPSNALVDHDVYEFFNRYAGIRQAGASNVGFIALRDAIDVADLERFPEADYGPLVAPADQQIYDNRVDNILSSGQPDALIDTRLTSLLTSGNNGSPFVNAARIAAIIDAVPEANYMPIEDGDLDSYHQDFGVHLIPGNYQLFISQESLHTTSVGVWRQPSDPLIDSMFGRFGRRFDVASGKDEMRFTLDPALIGAGQHHVILRITMLDSGTGAWSLQYSDGQTQRSTATIVNTGTEEVPSPVVFELEDFAGGGLLTGGSDFMLRHEGGDDTTFFLIEIERLAKLDQ